MHPSKFAPALLMACLFAASAVAEVERAASDSFVIVFNQTINATPAGAYSAVTRVDRWWSSDHTYSGDASNLSLVADAGGCWCERWKDGSVDHGRVILAMRDKLLRVQTALGPLQGKAVNGVLTFQLKPEQGSTLLTLSYRVNGTAASALDKDAPAVDKVLGEQFARLVRYIEKGKPVAE